MALKITGVKKIAVTTTAQDVHIGYNAFIIENLDAAATVYIKEKEGVACTSSNGFAIPAGTILDKVMTAETLSIVGSASADVRFLLVERE